jgi:signal transduction histidine kinase
VPKDTFDMIDSTLEEIDRLDRMLKSYMEFSGKWENFEKEKIAIDKLITDIISFHREEFSQKGIAIIFKKDNKNFDVYINPQLIHQVIINILINSRDIMNKEGAIHISLKKNGKKVIITIEDEGPGISEKIIEKIFEPFFSSRDGGFGLGLATVKKIIDNINGKIYVDNSDKGARFRIEL